MKEKSESALLIIIDIQDKLLAAIPDRNEILWNIKRLVDSSNILNVRVHSTEQNPQKLGRTNKLISENLIHKSIPKMSFSCANLAEIQNTIEINNITNIYLCGIECHVCVQQSALDFRRQGKNCFLIVDAISSRNKFDQNISQKYLVSSGATLTTTEAAIFQWCKTADRPEFKFISKIIKESMPHPEQNC